MMKSSMTLVLIALSLAPCYGEKQPHRVYPSADELPEREYLPDPFKFFGTDRYVKDMKDWKERQAQIKEMLTHYLIGDPIPHYFDDQEVVNVTTQVDSEYKVTIYDAQLRLGPPEKKMKYQLRYYLPDSRKPVPIILRIHTTKELEKLEDTIPHFAPRGYGLAQLRTGKMPTDLHPEIEKNNQNRIAWTISEVIHYLDKSHQIDKVILTGYSRWGKVTAAAGVLNERIDLTVPVVTGGIGVQTYANPDAFGSAHSVYVNSAGKYNRLPIDSHFIYAAIAPRAVLSIMGDEGEVKAQTLVEAYDAARIVYKWLGVEERVGLYDHSPRGHELKQDDYDAIMDFADLVFYDKKPSGGREFYKNTGPNFLKDQDIDATADWKIPPPVETE